MQPSNLVPRVSLGDVAVDGNSPNEPRSCYDYLSIPANKMAVDGPRPAESLRHLACSLAALNPAPWENVSMID